ncbi:D-alanyl-D-alanine carboxypeptidase/D-alanyl-D-alanine-endopeptidase [Humibacillus sp. DSM 29435]|uniref:D-alanyl-D-alanine carboxypeptidase/D-alanyl-D-alanine endopeptidase n=1 Tax=Humibacillus sp. DSM 29435 TaxID=1869167 RepID=UPI000871C09F|nr:D-alanyl-D-alanine carboxypeptidase/D-alanyl-D-alanine-endopeptidase [Humibacillus sp. DSM 29435]OFE18857.1 D-alanyl-D-alanine carboxypeptidase/D-alanyl-D-alanine-endopeptidase [Humibacillus sp. DSM 29435]
MKRAWAALAAVGVLVAGYAALDAADLAPGLLTTAPAPPPPPTETPGTRTLPLVPQPTPTTSAGMPLPPLSGASAAPDVAGIRGRLGPVTALPALSDSSLVVRDGQTGDVLYDRDGDLLRTPASTTKLLSAASIGQTFAPGATLRTRVVAGVGPSEIVLVAGGDSLLAPGKGDPNAVAGRAGLADLAGQVAKSLKAKALTSVTLSVDTTYAAGPPVAPTWGAGFRPLGITAAVAMLGRSDQRETAGKASPADPVASTRDLFAKRLRERGLQVTVSTKPAKPRVETDGAYGSVESAPVRDQLALAITDSDNALTEILARQAAFRSGIDTDAADGFARTGAWVVSKVGSLGLATKGIVLRDGSGLSRENRVTANLLTELLVLGYDGRHAVLRAALDGLPIAGLTGTLADRFDGGATRPAAGRARAKTGTLTGVSALAGSVVDDDGRLLVYSGLVAGAGTNEARAALDRFVAVIASCGCRAVP